jgi:hypothetical protein
MALPLLGIALTIYQITSVISHNGRQQYRTLVASFDILLATFTSNAVVLGSLLQDRGYKKEKKYKFSPTAIIKRNSQTTRRPTTRWGSDEDLMRSGDSNEDGKDGSGRGVVIGLTELKKKSAEETRKPVPPPKAMFPEIRIASTWEVKVVERSDSVRAKQ